MMLSILSPTPNLSTDTRWQHFAYAACVLSLIGLALFFPISHALSGMFGIMLLLFSLLAGQWPLAYQTIRHHRLALLIICFFMLIILSLSYTTVDFHQALADSKKYIRLATIPLLMVLFKDKRLRQWAIAAFITTMTLTCLLAFFKFFNWMQFNFPDPNAVFMNRIQTSFMLAFAAFISAHWSCRESKARPLYMLLTLMFSVNILLINTAKTGLLIYLGLLLLFIWQKTPRRKLLLPVISVVVLLSLLGLFSNNFRHMVIEQPIDNLVKYQQKQYTTSAGARLTFAKYGLMIGARHPLLGTGIGSHHIEFTKYDLPQFSNGLPWGDPHNQYVLIFFELGGVGLLLLLYIFFTQWRLSYQLPEEMRYLAQGLVVSFLLGNACDSLMYLSSTGQLYAYFTGLCFAPHLADERSC